VEEKEVRGCEDTATVIVIGAATARPEHVGDGESDSGGCVGLIGVWDRAVRVGGVGAGMAAGGGDGTVCMWGEQWVSGIVGGGTWGGWGGGEASAEGCSDSGDAVRSGWGVFVSRGVGEGRWRSLMGWGRR